MLKQTTSISLTALIEVAFFCSTLLYYQAIKKAGNSFTSYKQNFICLFPSNL